MTWNPEQYNKFKAERSQPFFDLVAGISSRSGLNILDLGCGTGELTSTLNVKFPNSQIVGIDNSPEMLERAKAYQTENIRFELRDQQDISGSWDLIVSNAALQWSDDHPRLFAHIYEHLNPGGELAVQMPNNHQSRTHRTIRDVASMPHFAQVLDGYERQSPMLTILEYANLMFDLGAEHINVTEKVYPHILPDAANVVEWIRGTALLPYLEHIGSLREEFLAEISDRITSQNPKSPVFYPFNRIFISAVKPE